MYLEERSPSPPTSSFKRFLNEQIYNKKKKSSWEFPKPKKLGTPYTKTAFLLFLKIAFLNDFGQSGAPFGKVLGVQIESFWDQQIDNFC